MLGCVNAPAQQVFGRTLLVIGSESLLMERAIASRVRAATRADAAAEVTQIQAANLDAGRFAEMTGGSLFASATCAVLDDISGLPAEMSDQVIATALDPAPDLALILTHPGGARGKGLLDRLRQDRRGVVEQVAANPLKAWETPGFVIAEARHAKATIDQDAAQALVDAVGTDLRTLVAAVSQLASDNEGGTIDIALIGRFFGGRADATSFAVADEIMQGRPGPALEKLRWALATGVAPVLITSAIASSLRALGKYGDLRSSRLPDAEAARELGVPPWKVKDIAKLSRGWTPEAVSRALRSVALADGQVKGTASDPDFALEQLLLAIDQARSSA